MLIEVTESDIREGVAEDCDCCPVAIAASRATGYDCAVFSLDWVLSLRVGHLIMRAPYQVREFVMEFDDLERERFGCREKPKLATILPDGLKPFSFEIPDLTDGAWEEQCYGCEELCNPSELDREGYCAGCAAKNAEPEAHPRQ